MIGIETKHLCACGQHILLNQLHIPVSFSSQPTIKLTWEFINQGQLNGVEM